MQIDSLTSAPFSARVGKYVTVEAAKDELALEVKSVKENPLAAGPGAKRTPFTVILHGPNSPNLADGQYHLRTDGENSWRIENIYLNRIIPPVNSNGAGAYYQVIFG